MKLKYVQRKIDRHGKVRWYYHRGGRYWPLPNDPTIDRTEYDAIANMIAIGHPPRRQMTARERRRPESAFTREIERAIKRAETRARSRSWEFDLTEVWVRDRIAKQNGRCVLTGIPFTTTPEPGRRNPFAPSIDRVDCSRGYTKDNVRIVLLSVNIALSDWGEEHFATIAHAYVGRLASKKNAA